MLLLLRLLLRLLLLLLLRWRQAAAAAHARLLGCRAASATRCGGCGLAGRLERAKTVGADSCAGERVARWLLVACVDARLLGERSGAVVLPGGMFGPSVGSEGLRKGALAWALELGGRGYVPDASYSPLVATRSSQAPRLVLLAAVTSDDVLCDLGCGEAGLLCDLARLTGCSAYGCDVDADALRCGQSRVDAEGLAGRVTLHQAFIEDFDLERATVVFVFLVPLQLEALRPKLQRFLDASPRNRVISQRFEVCGLRALRDEVPDCEAALGELDAAGRGAYFGSGLGKAFCYARA